MNNPRRNFGRRKSDRFKIAVGMGLTFVLGGLILQLNQCGGSTEVSGPTSTTSTQPAVSSNPTPTPSATPTAAPAAPAGPEHNGTVTKGGAYSITNETEIPQFYCAAAFGVYPGGEQGAGTNLYQDQGTYKPKDVFSGQFPKSAACQYKQIQGDLTQSQDCRNFDWYNVLSAAVWDNPGYIEGKWILDEKPEYGTWSSCEPVVGESSTQEPSCQKHRTVTYYETYTCGNARRIARTSTEYASCECPCVEPHETSLIYGASSWFENEILEGRCPNGEVLPISIATTPELNCHVLGTQKTTLDYQCRADEDGNPRSLCKNVACPPPNFCFYEVSGFFKALDCLQEGGQWENWDNEFHNNHCRVPFPGTTDRDFQLTPGQSDNGCKSKHD